MIQWTKLLFTTLWTLGSAILLATLSLAHWSASQSGGTLRQTLTELPFRLAMTIAFILVALGLTLSVEPWWHKIVWFGVLILSIWEGLAGWHDRPGRSEQC